MMGAEGANMKRYKNVYQFKITLKGTKPPVWRRIQVPETYTFYDLHVAIQDAMGWEDTHLHEFVVNKPPGMREVRIGIPSDDDDVYEREILQGWSNKISKYFNEWNKKALYVYDFGDNWQHVIEFEKVLPKDPNRTYPICIAGKRACPPEDCGGVWLYQELCQGTHPYQEAYADFDPEKFDVREVWFSDPKLRFKEHYEMTEDGD